MNYNKFCFLAVVFLSQFVHIFADSFIITNKTEVPLFVALYFQRSAPDFFAEQMREPVQVNSGASVVIERPSSKKIVHRKGVVSGSRELLKKKLTHREYVNFAHFSITEKAGDSFEITRDEKNLLIVKGGLQPHVKSLIQTTLSKATDVKQEMVSKVKTPFVPEVAPHIVVREGTELCQQEQEFLKKRMPLVNQAIVKAIGPCSAEATPIVSVLGSGGGYRAFIGFLGVILGLEELGLWDACTYSAGVSGSTWLLSALYGSKKSLKEFPDYIRPRLQNNLLTQNIYNTKETLALFKQKEDFTLVDAWGLLLSKAMFGDKQSLGTHVKLSSLQEQINEGQMPLPICTALHRGMSSEVYFEYTPYEVGSVDYKAFIPAAYAGAHFNRGVCQEAGFKEYPLGLHCGVFGSAFAVDLERVSKSVNNLFFSLLAQKTRLRGLQASTGSLVNFMQGIDSMEMSRDTNLKVLDSGAHLNLPMMPIMHRKPDILIVANMTANPHVNTASALTIGVEFAAKKGYVMPALPEKEINAKAVTIIYDESKSDAPLIIFIPNLYGPYSTLKLEYSAKEFNDFFMAIKKAVVDNKQLIYDAFKKVIAKKELKKDNGIEEVEVKEPVSSASVTEQEVPSQDVVVQPTEESETYNEGKEAVQEPTKIEDVEEEESTDQEEADEQDEVDEQDEEQEEE